MKSNYSNAHKACYDDQNQHQSFLLFVTPIFSIKQFRLLSCCTRLIAPVEMDVSNNSFWRRKSSSFILAGDIDSHVAPDLLLRSSCILLCLLISFCYRLSRNFRGHFRDIFRDIVDLCIFQSIKANHKVAVWYAKHRVWIVLK